MSGRYASLVLRCALGGVATAASLILLGLWSDERYVRRYQEKEQIAIRLAGGTPWATELGRRGAAARAA
jgi:hypothetical protein